MTNTNKEILRLAIPAIVSNITTPLLALADTAITGHMGAAAYIGAIAIGSSMMSMAYWLMAFLRMGTSGLTAQAVGADMKRQAYSLLWQSLSIALIISALIIVGSPWIGDLLLAFMDADGTTSHLAEVYFQIVIFGAPGVLGTYALSGWLLGMQDSKSPMWMAITTNVINIAASVALVFVFGMGIEGVALGTLISQWIGMLMGIWIIHSRYHAFDFLHQYRNHHKLKTLFSKEELKKLFSVNLDIFLRTLCLVAVTLWFTRSGASQGTLTLAANALLMQLFILFSYFMDGFAFAGEAMAGKYYGMNDKPMLSVAIKRLMQWGAGVAAFFTLLYLCAGRLILFLLTDDMAVVDTAVQFLPWAVAVPIAGVAAFAWDGIFIGMTKTRGMLLSIFISSIVFFALYFLLTPTLGNHGLWIAFLSYLASRGFVQTLIWRK